MEYIKEDEALAVSLVQAIQTGNTRSLEQLLINHPGLARVRIVQKDNSSHGTGITRTLLHVATDWPGHFPGGAATVNLLVQFGAEVDAPFTGPHTETPLHWAASCNDISVLDALLDAGADLEAPGAVIAGGTPLDDAVAFGQWDAARRLVERGARMALWHAAALGRIDVIEAHFAGSRLEERYPWGASSDSPPDKVTVAFWCACHGGQTDAAAYLLQQGAELNWRAVWDGLTPLDAAKRSGATDTVSWLVSQGGQSAQDGGVPRS
ncbi:ankyrin repeat domain-containing protein [Paenibacillus daejeonensis]|uniref:ankyrin repeat domain-containing protein n=1 Tax=Paenibacillus daejeonensis TaxID=135193 RepID=UPI0003742DC7|nr:ankyrin repeat domain-containing protein [Paenibacillus daejeonensis]